MRETERGGEREIFQFNIYFILPFSTSLTWLVLSIKYLNKTSLNAPFSERGRERKRGRESERYGESDTVIFKFNIYFILLCLTSLMSLVLSIKYLNKTSLNAPI